MNLWSPRLSRTVVAGSQIGRGSWMTSRRHTCCSIPNRFAVAVHPTGESEISTSRGWINDHTNGTQQTFIAVHSTNNCFTPGDTKECHLRPLFRFERHPRQVSLISNSIVGIIGNYNIQTLSLMELKWTQIAAKYLKTVTELCIVSYKYIKWAENEPFTGRIRFVLMWNLFIYLNDKLVWQYTK